MIKILFADDDPMMRDLYSMKFKKLGYEIFLANDAKEALGLFKANQPDVLLLDRRLGEDDGLILLKQIRSEPGVKIIPAIIFSNQDATAEDLATIKQYPLTQYLVKEKIDLNDLAKIISELAA